MHFFFQVGAAFIAGALVNNTSLLTLNLSFNRIGDTGVKHLAQSLRMNRTLLSLNVGSNEVIYFTHLNVGLI